MVGRTLKLRYRRSALGYLWTLLIPLSTATIYYFLFKVVFKVQIPDFAAFVVTGILVWSFFSGTLVEGMESLLGNVSLLLQVNVPLNLFPLTTAIGNLTTLVFALPVILGLCLVNGVVIGWPALLFFYYLALLWVQAYCLSYMLSITVIYLRDLRQAMGLVMQVWMYGTPILYQSNYLPPKYFWVLYANPVGKIFTGIHSSLLRNQWPTLAEIATPTVWTAVIFMVTLYLHTKVSKQAVERI
jgi:ABC-2 type transport system permease protein